MLGPESEQESIIYFIKVSYIVILGLGHLFQNPQKSLFQLLHAWLEKLIVDQNPLVVVRATVSTPVVKNYVVVNLSLGV